MKRAFSLTELQSAIEPCRALEEPLKECAVSFSGGLLRRSKSLGSLESLGGGGFPNATVDDAKSPTEPVQALLPSLSSLGLTFPSSGPGMFHLQHGFEELKRCRGLTGRLHGHTPDHFLAASRDYENRGLVRVEQDEETRGAASALMELFRQNSSNVPVRRPADCEVFQSPPSNSMLLPSLKELLANSVAVQAKEFEPAVRPPEPHSPSTPDTSSVKTASDDNITRDHSDAKPQQEPASPAAAAEDDVKHNKYCHFCQHVKVKRASSMLACENAECARRFCEHCLQTHLQDDPIPQVRSRCEGKWLCAICRRTCCCSLQLCVRDHRHCKAYRYRQRRAEQAAQRTQHGGRLVVTASPAADGRGVVICASLAPATPKAAGGGGAAAAAAASAAAAAAAAAARGHGKPGGLDMLGGGMLAAAPRVAV